jgi:hypothetical protein
VRRLGLPQLDRRSTTTLAQNAFMEGGIDLAAAVFPRLHQHFPHTRSSQSFTAVLKDFAGPIAFSNCKSADNHDHAVIRERDAGIVHLGRHRLERHRHCDVARHRPVVGGTVAYKLYSDANCTQLLANGGTKTVSARRTTATSRSRLRIRCKSTMPARITGRPPTAATLRPAVPINRSRAPAAMRVLTVVAVAIDHEGRGRRDRERR